MLHEWRALTPTCSLARLHRQPACDLFRPRPLCEAGWHDLDSASGHLCPTENLAGLVERVTFHTEENGFCVLRLKARGQRDLITVIGHAAMISAGEWVQAAGTWTNDPTHGLQFRANFLKATAPTTLAGIEKYLGSGMIRG